MEWDKLSLQDKAKYIRLGVQSGIYDLDVIKQHINSSQNNINYFEWGGHTKKKSNNNNSSEQEYIPIYNTNSDYINVYNKAHDDYIRQNFQTEILPQIQEEGDRLTHILESPSVKAPSIIATAPIDNIIPKTTYKEPSFKKTAPRGIVADKSIKSIFENKKTVKVAEVNEDGNLIYRDIKSEDLKKVDPANIVLDDIGTGVTVITPYGWDIQFNKDLDTDPLLRSYYNSVIAPMLNADVEDLSLVNYYYDKFRDYQERAKDYLRREAPARDGNFITLSNSYENYAQGLPIATSLIDSLATHANTKNFPKFMEFVAGMPLTETGYGTKTNYNKDQWGYQYAVTNGESFVNNSAFYSPLSYIVNNTPYSMKTAEYQPYYKDGVLHNNKENYRKSFFSNDNFRTDPAFRQGALRAEELLRKDLTYRNWKKYLNADYTLPNYYDFIADLLHRGLYNPGNKTNHAKQTATNARIAMQDSTLMNLLREHQYIDDNNNVIYNFKSPKLYGPGGPLDGPIDSQRYQDDIEYRKSVLASLSQQQKSKQARVDAAYKKEQQQGKANEVTNYQTQTERAEQDRIDKDNADKYVHGLFDEKSWRDFALTQAAGVAAFPLVYYTAPYIWKGANLVGDVYLPYDLATRGYDLAHNFYDMYKYRNPTNAEERLKLATARVDAFENGFGVAGDALGLSSALSTTDKMMTRAAEMGIRNSGGHTTGMPYITNIKNDIKASQIKPTIDYILGVTPEAPKKQIFYDNNYNGFTGPLSDYVSTDVDMVSAFLHNKEIDSDVLTFKGRGKDFGVHTDYINKVYPKKAPKIPVYEQRGMDIGNYQQVKVVGKEGSIDTNISGVRVDAGGHLGEIVRSEDGTYYMREQDIWKYNRPEYREKWLMPHNGNIFKNFLQDRALDYLNAKGTPVITRSSWRPITEVDFIMAGIDIPQDYSSYKQLQAESKYLDFEKSLQQVKKPTKAQNAIANIDKGAVENPSTEISKNN